VTIAAQDELSSGPRQNAFHNMAIVAGPLLGITCWYFTGGEGGDSPDPGLGPSARIVLAATVWMAVWWMTEAVHLTVTALLPLVLFPVFGVASIKEVAQPYADPVIYLFLASFVIALSMQRWGLGLRAALLILKRFGTEKRKVVAGFMVVTALFSMFVSNTATVAMMLPIALGIVALGERNRTIGESSPESTRSSKSFATCIALGTAYASSIGGMATIIGTPPNAFLRSFLMSDAMPDEHKIDLTFATWIVWGIPYAAVFLVATWWLLTRVLFRFGNEELQGGKELVDGELRRLGRIDSGEWWTLGAFAITVLLWLFRPLLVAWEFGSNEASWKPLAGLDDSVIAIGAAILLFLIPCNDPAGNRTRVMNWETARQLPWEVLLLFGGGLSLAASIQKTGVAEWLGQKLVFLEGFPDWVIVLMVVTIVVFLTELTSNVATTASLLPVLAGMAIQLGISPWLLAIPATLSASCAFMLPVATPPNAIVFGTGHVTVREMMRAGFWLNLFAIFWTTLLSCTLIRWWLDI
jgi:solute carrier family 13 (sodium-dependent dicarboxylate transporter), member 2/3/5